MAVSLRSMMLTLAWTATAALVTADLAATVEGALVANAQQRSLSSTFLLSNTLQTIPFDTTNVSTGGFTVGAPGVFTAPETGLYAVAGSLTVAPGGSTPAYGGVYVNGVLQDGFYTQSSFSSYSEVAFEHLTMLNAGDTVQVQVAGGSGGQIAPGPYSKASVTQYNANGYQGVEAQQRSLSSTFLLSNTLQTIPFDTTNVSTGGFTVGAPGVFTAPETGLYAVAGSLTVAPGGSTPAYGGVYVNGVLQDGFYTQSSFSSYSEVAFEHLTMLNAGDTVQVQVAGGSGGQIAPGPYSKASVTQYNANGYQGVEAQQRSLSSTFLLSNTLQTIPFDTTNVSTGGFTVGAPGVFTAPETGLYAVAGSLTVAPGGSTPAYGGVYVNGVLQDGFYTQSSFSSYSEVAFEHLTMLNAGDTVQVQVAGGSGGQIAPGPYSRANITLFRDIVVPEPASLAMAGAAAISLISIARRR